MKHKVDISNRFAIVMAGGRGERFWPVSREKRPKQLIKLLGERSFLQEAVERIRPLVPPHNIFVITNAAQAADVRKQLPRALKANVVAEPIGRDTCAAVTLGAAIVAARAPGGVMAVLPADHVIPDADAFRRVLSDAFDVAAERREIVTIGIEPTEPATGYGYIRLGRPLEATGARSGRAAFRRAERFVEKPPHARAVRYLQSGRYRWNAGMFVWSVATITESLAMHQPAMHAAWRRWRKAASDGPARLADVLAREYPRIEKISIDYALLERADNVVVADGTFEWDDLGSWTALARHIAADAAGNCAVGDLVAVDAADNIVFDARTKRRTPIALVGLRDCIVVQTDDAVLVAHKGEAQKIKQLVAKIAADGRFENLV